MNRKRQSQRGSFLLSLRPFRRGWLSVLLMAQLVGQPVLSLAPGSRAGERQESGLPASSVPSSPRGNEPAPEQEEGSDAPEEESLSFSSGHLRQARRKSERLAGGSPTHRPPPGRSFANAPPPARSASPLLFTGGVLPLRC